MNPPTQQQVVLGNHQYPSVAPVVFNNPNQPDERLWGANVRRVLGILQIICGGIECVLGIAVIFVPIGYYYDFKDYVGWGIWHGAFAIVTGFLGVFSLRKKGMVIAYMITSIIAAVISPACFIYAMVGVVDASFSYNRASNLAMYTILCIISFTQMVISIIGASFTCGAVCSSPNQPQQVVYYTPQPLPQQNVPAPPYTVVASQGGYPSQINTPGVNAAYMPGKI